MSPILFDRLSVGPHHMQGFAAARRQLDEQSASIDLIAGSADVPMPFQCTDGLGDGLPGHTESIGEGRGMQRATDQRDQGYRLGGAYAVQSGGGERGAQPGPAAGRHHLQQRWHRRLPRTVGNVSHKALSLPPFHN